MLVQLSKYKRREDTDAQKNSFSVKKVTKCNLKSKAQIHEKCFLSNEMNSFLQCRRQIFMSLSFFAEKSQFLELKCTKSLFRASKNTNSVFSATKQNYKNAEATDAQNIFLSEKSY